MKEDSFEKRLFNYIVDNPDSTISELLNHFKRGENTLRIGLKFLLIEKLIYEKTINKKKYYSARSKSWKRLNDFFQKKISVVDYLTGSETDCE